MAAIPQILKDIPPEKFRELIEELLGGPLQHQSSSIGCEVIDDPSDEQRKQPHIELSHGRIMIPHHRAELHFRTGWHDASELRGDDDANVRLMYMGTATDSRFLSQGEEKTCKDRWTELLETAEPADAVSPAWPEVKEAIKIGWRIYGFGKLIEWIREFND